MPVVVKDNRQDVVRSSNLPPNNLLFKVIVGATTRYTLKVVEQPISVDDTFFNVDSSRNKIQLIEGINLGDGATVSQSISNVDVFFTESVEINDEATESTTVSNNFEFFVEGLAVGDSVVSSGDRVEYGINFAEGLTINDFAVTSNNVIKYNVTLLDSFTLNDSVVSSSDTVEYGLNFVESLSAEDITLPVSIGNFVGIDFVEGISLSSDLVVTPNLLRNKTVSVSSSFFVNETFVTTIKTSDFTKLTDFASVREVFRFLKFSNITFSFRDEINIIE